MMHPAKSALVALGKKFPEMAKTVDYVAFGDGAQAAGEWPEEYLLPKQAWRGLLNYLSSSTHEAGPQPDFDELRFLGTWAKTQGYTQRLRSFIPLPWLGGTALNALKTAAPPGGKWVENTAVAMVGGGRQARGFSHHFDNFPPTSIISRQLRQFLIYFDTTGSGAWRACAFSYENCSTTRWRLSGQAQPGGERA